MITVTEQIHLHLLAAKESMREAQMLLENGDDPYDEMDRVIYAIEDLMEIE